jgi:hypothetical protein
VPSVSPFAIFWISFAVTIGTGITGGTVHLAHIVPAAYIDAVDSYVDFAVFIGSTFLTMAAAAGMTKQSVLSSAQSVMTTQDRLAIAAAVPEVKSIVTTQAIADVAPSNKVVGPTP